jgi:hypothetical protein
MAGAVQHIAGVLIEKAAADLAAELRAMPEERARWMAGPDARSALEQVVECSLANVMWSNILRTRVHESLPQNVADHAYRTLDTVEKAVERLLASAHVLVEVIRGLDPKDLGSLVPFPWKPENGRTVAECCFHPYWNMVYHQGQLAFIQTLYGDLDEHCDAGPFGE